jgi:hypothetical protein
LDLISKLAFLFEFVEGGDMAEGIDDGLEDGVAEGEEDDYEDGDEEVVSRSVVVAQLL